MFTDGVAASQSLPAPTLPAFSTLSDGPASNGLGSKIYYLAGLTRPNADL